MKPKRNTDKERYKKVKVRFSLEYDVDAPKDWDKHMVEFHRNESSWCQSNGWREMLSARKQTGCCGGKFEVIDMYGNEGEPSE